MKRATLLILIGACSISSICAADSILENIFRPSIDRGGIINVGNTANQVGNTFFAGGTEIKAQIGKNGKPYVCYLSNMVVEVSENTCSGNKEWKTYQYYSNNTQYTASHCVSTKETPIQTNEAGCAAGGKISAGICRVSGRKVHISEATQEACEAQKGQRKVIEGEGGIFNVNKKEPLMVRITKLLLRITVTLSITFTLINAIQYALSMTDSGKAAESQKKLINIAIGVVIALSSISIIYLIQSIINKSI